MSVHIIPIDFNDDIDIMEVVCTGLFKQWQDFYVKFYNVNSPNELVIFFQRFSHILTMYVAITDDGIFKGCYTISQKGNVRWISDVYVIPSERNKGIGKMLIEHAMQNQKYVALSAPPELTSYYEKFGFKKCLQRQLKSKNGDVFEYFPMYYEEKMSDAEVTANLLLWIVAIGLILIFIVWRFM